MALRGGVGVVTAKHETIAREATVLKRWEMKNHNNIMDTDLCRCHDRIVGARLARDGGAKPVKGVVALVLDTKHAGHAHSWAGRGN